MNVLIVLTSTQRRGAEIQGSQLALALRERGCTATVVALHAGAAPALGVRVLGPRPLALSTLWRLRRAASEADVVIGYGSSTLPAGVLALFGKRTPFVYRSIGDPEQWVRGRLHRFRTRLLYRATDGVVALWQGSAVSLHSLYGLSPSKVSVIPNARRRLEETPTSREVARAILGLPLGARIVAFVGSLSEEKRPEDAVAAVACLRDAVLVSAGDGPLRDGFLSAAERLLPGRHFHLGTLDNLSNLWSASDVLLMTSRTEGMPGSIIEAALHGVPAVATRVGAVGALINDGETGLIVDPGATSAEYSVAIDTAIADRQRLGGGARDHAEASFVWDAVVDRWMDVLLGIVGTGISVCTANELGNA